MSRPSSPETDPIAGDSTETTPASSVSQENDSGPDKSLETEPETAPAEAPDGEKDDDQPEASEKDMEGKDGEGNEGLKDMDAQSDSDDSDADSDEDNFRISTRAIDRLATQLPTPTLLKVYKKRLQDKAKKKGQQHQGSALVRGLVDYLRVLEDRIDQLETKTGTKTDQDNDKSKEPTEDPSSDPNGSAVEVTVKFFNSAAYLGEDGSYPEVDDKTEKGTFLCDHDAQHLIRAMYSRLKDDGGKPTMQADSEPPDPAEIDILTFGVSSEAILAFFSKLLGVEAGGSQLIRFGKPFRPLIRNLPRVREHLGKLENSYGRVPVAADIGGMGDPQPAGAGTLEAADSDVQGETDSDVLPFASAENNSDDDDVQPFDRPTALPHFQAFLAFIDKYLGKEIHLYERLREGKESHIAFENLWMLFDANETIYCPYREAGTDVYNNIEGRDHTPIRRHTPQAYRVVATSGGMPLARTMAPSSKRKEREDSTIGPVSFGGSLLGAGTKAIAEILTQTATISRKIRNNYTELNLYCFFVDFDGARYGTVPEVFVFKPYEREMEIRNLQVYPARYMLNDRLHDRGQSFLKVTKISHLQYEGLTVGPNREEINSPVVVDVKLAFEGGREADKALIEVPEMRSLTSLWLPDSAGEAFDLFGKSSCPRKWCYSRGCTANVYIGSQKLQRDKIENDIKLGLEEYEGEKQRGKEGEDRFKKIMEEKEIVRLLPGAVPGFALRNRKWVLLDLNRLGPINKQGNGWDDLVLPPGHRDMVQAMVETHTQDLGSNKDATVGMDLVQGKGRGCIILLHGVPGVGKTSTAECVAAHTKKPLYPITCGDIGYRPEDVERNMESHFKLAHKWGCVLLLDEADVFLAKRDQKDVQRNGLVSVFLRILEYYSGILFLTTNRVGAIDDAFRSRLHLTLYYPKLTRKQTKEIFKKNFGRMAEINDERIEKKLLPFEYKDSETKVLDWVKQNWKTLAWNGRQIRNTFQTALSLAEFQAKQDGAESQGPVVRKKHFMIVANASAQFNEYLRATHGYDEEVVASRELTRAVQYTPSPNLAFKGFDDTDTSSDEEAEEDTDDDSSDSDSDSDDSDKETKKKKNKSKGKKEKDDSKSSPKKNKKMSSNKKEKSDKKEKAEKKEKVQDKKPSKEKKKGNKGTGDNNSDDSE